mgnify:CR=1 FL=1
MTSKEKVSATPLWHGLPHQIIYFGSPGTGKSWFVKNRILDGIDDEFIFRTTFHPDSDYSSFVGSYKPVTGAIQEGVDKAFSMEELAEMLKSYYKSSRVKVTALLTFVLRHIAYFDGSIANYNKKEFFAKAVGSSSYSAEANKIVNLYGWMKDNGYINADGNIIYRFEPQVFTDAYVKSWLNLGKPVFLVIEEINRGNCAQIFGDLFQLLDRDDDGSSAYSVNADASLRMYLESRLGAGTPGIAGGKLTLPPNFHIIATMNTSDQSLFPMDSAFKRRWEWEYIPIDTANPDSQFVIAIGDRRYSWTDFLAAVNGRIRNVCESEDKQIGNFFIKGNIDERQFKNKVMFYLWSEICKDEFRHKSFFRNADDAGNEFSFNDLYSAERLPDMSSRSTALLHGFMSYLGVKAIR